MALADLLDPTSSVLAFYATDLRRKREGAGISQRAFAKQALMAPSLLNKIEAGTRLPTKDLSALADSTFGTTDHFQRLWPLVIKYAYPAWFRPYVDLEEAATVIRSFQVQVIPGLLQTEDYARAVFATTRPDRDILEEQVAARLERQHILARDDRPELWVILDELVLRRAHGTDAVMRAQLDALLAAADEPRTVVQVIPFSVRGHAGSEGAFSALTLDEGPGVVYVDGFLQGQILGDPSEFKAAERRYDLLTADALSPSASIDLIATAMKDLR
ncbi:transcriptional regulator with XRE-family HTH domain [Kitasatospora sp. MAP12-15]|uniref:helix-turn-helix domain-containing protein n=1 Tax=unclassified Kitasatospora TaxID=2633591 RepID=UPI002473E4FE|nr:helix-turn-helix transcriptional regulator [Kitasatospora sp. MAP12-44]MDH6112303.1 transcriptional regulator with XRE-family HTH domain [Kitasatospora sp. MAP12-44]